MKTGGMVSLLFLAIILTLGMYLLASLPVLTARDIQGGRNTALALREARDALIGYSIQDANRPGSLPCPDTNNDGVVDLFSGDECLAYVGRLPWKTLGLSDLRDAAGERLWYAMSRNFRDRTSAQPINSDTTGTLTVYAADGTTLMTPGAVAVIFSAGSALGSQNRGAASASCAATGTSLSRDLCADNYLDQLNCPGANCRNNAVGPFVAGPGFDAQGRAVVNDTLLAIRAGDLMPAVEKRVAKELISWLQVYYTANHYYPYPARYDHCDREHCSGDSATCRGRIPGSEASGDASWSPPAWFVNNQWNREFYYSVGDASLQFPTGLCAASLSVSGANAGALFFTPGTPVGAVVRPSNNLTDYLEDAENQDGWGVGANDAYVVPTSRLNDRDRIYPLP